MSESFSFDSNGVPPAAPREPIPPDWYRMYIVGSAIKPTKDGRGKLLELEFTVLDGKYKGRRVWARLNVVNRSEQAQEIARRELSAICHATGVLRFRTPQELHHKPLLVKVTVEKDPGFAEKNAIIGYREADDKLPPPMPPRSEPVRTGVAAAAQEDDDDDLPF